MTDMDVLPLLWRLCATQHVAVGSVLAWRCTYLCARWPVASEVCAWPAGIPVQLPVARSRFAQRASLPPNVCISQAEEGYQPSADDFRPFQVCICPGMLFTIDLHTQRHLNAPCHPCTSCTCLRPHSLRPCRLPALFVY